MQAVFDPDTNLFGASVRATGEGCVVASDGSSDHTVEVAVMSVMIDADGEPISETFYPYYGSTEKQKFLPTPQPTFQSTFQPYAVVSIQPEVAPQFAAGSPTAIDILSDSFAIYVEVDQLVDAVKYVTFAAVDLPAVLTRAEVADIFAQEDAVNTSTAIASGEARLVDGSQNLMEWTASIQTSTGGAGGVFSTLVAVQAGCTTTYGIVDSIQQPDVIAPSFSAVTVDSSCNNFDVASETARYTVQAQLSEPAKVRPNPDTSWPVFSAR